MEFILKDKNFQHYDTDKNIAKCDTMICRHIQNKHLAIQYVSMLKSSQNLDVEIVYVLPHNKVNT